MQIQLFHIPAVENAEALSELNRFLATHKVLEVEQSFYYRQHSANWCFCVRFLPVQHEGNTFLPRVKTDYKQLLNETEFTVFSRLREIRKHLSVADAIPAYAIFTDEELANIARLDELTPQKIKSINGIGEKKAEKYGKQLIEVYQQNQQSEP